MRVRVPLVALGTAVVIAAGGCLGTGGAANPPASTTAGFSERAAESPDGGFVIAGQPGSPCGRLLSAAEANQASGLTGFVRPMDVTTLPPSPSAASTATAQATGSTSSCSGTLSTNPSATQCGRTGTRPAGPPTGSGAWDRRAVARQRRRRLRQQPLGRHGPSRGSTSIFDDLEDNLRGQLTTKLGSCGSSASSSSATGPGGRYGVSIVREAPAGPPGSPGWGRRPGEQARRHDRCRFVATRSSRERWTDRRRDRARVRRGRAPCGQLAERGEGGREGSGGGTPTSAGTNGRHVTQVAAE